MLTSLSQFQAQGWEKWLSRITFTRGTNSLKSNPMIRNSVLLSRSTFKPTVRIFLLYLRQKYVAKIELIRQTVLGHFQAATL